MPFKRPTIVVTGDVCVERLYFPIKPKDNGLNWELNLGTRLVKEPGDALLLSEFLRKSIDAAVFSTELKDVDEIPPEEILYSNAELDFFPFSNDPKEKNNPVYRIKRFLGFTGPATGTPGLLHVKNEYSDPDIVILDDTGNGFREKEEYWPKAISEKGKKPLVIFKMSSPLVAGKLWNHISSVYSGKLVVVVNADDLRASGVNISRCLSWERTALDFVWQMACNTGLLPLVNCPNLVVCFGLEGAIHYMRKGNRIESHLYFDPALIEDEFKDRHPGEMQGLSAAFVASLAARIATLDTKKEDIYDATGEGVAFNAGLHVSAYTTNDTLEVNMTVPLINGGWVFGTDATTDTFASNYYKDSLGTLHSDYLKSGQTVTFDLSFYHETNVFNWTVTPVWTNTP